MKSPKQWVYHTRLRAPKRSEGIWRWFTHGHLRTLRIFAKYCPLIAAVLAPLSTLLDIPALTEPWFTLDGVPVRDFRASLVLSAVGLALNILANAFLVIRFSSSKEKRWRRATSWSTLCWLGAFIVEIINLALFGPRVHRKQSYEPTEGFWCAIVSLVDAGVICIALVFHYAFDFSFGPMDDDDETELRLEGRKFMLSVTFFLLVIGLQAFAYSRLEGWLYSDAIYFSIQWRVPTLNPSHPAYRSLNALTIGYGDLVPVNTWGKILVFPFFVLTISQLANEVLIIFGFIKDRAEQRRNEWRKRYEAAMHAEANTVRPMASLVQEMALIQDINKREEMMSQMYDLIWSALALFVFWVSGAAIFQAIEGWSYGNATYAVVILTTTIGFGDFVPTAPLGRIVWIPYTLMAVPIITSFAGQTIAGVLSAFFRPACTKEAIEGTVRDTPEAFRPHSDYIIRAHEAYQDIRRRLDEQRRTRGAAGVHEKRDDGERGVSVIPPGSRSLPVDNVNLSPHNCGPTNGEKGGMGSLRRKTPHENTETQECNDQQTDGGKEDAEEEGVRELESHLLRKLVDLMVRLETEARQMLLDSMGNGLVRTLFLADRNVQIRDVRALRGDDANILAIWSGDTELTTVTNSTLSSKPEAVPNPSLPGNSKEPQGREGRTPSQLAGPTEAVVQQARKYRNTFAEILVVGALLQDLHGEELGILERWTGWDRVGEEEIRRGEKPAKVEGNAGSLARSWLRRLKTALDWAFGD